MDEINSSKNNYHLIPELAVGVSKKLMLRASTFFSNRTKKFKNEGGSVCGKYRFLSNDAIQKHFRMAAFVTMSFNNSDIHQEEISMTGMIPVLRQALWPLHCYIRLLCLPQYQLQKH